MLLRRHKYVVVVVVVVVRMAKLFKYLIYLNSSITYFEIFSHILILLIVGIEFHIILNIKISSSIYYTALKDVRD